MIPQIPKRPYDRDPGSIWDQRVGEAVFGSAQSMHVQGVKVNKTTRGTSIVLSPVVQQASGKPAKMFVLQSVQGDYVTAHTWDGTTEGTANVYLAKDLRSQESATAEDYLGDTYLFTYTSTDHDSTRTVTRNSDSATENQRLLPPWTTEEILSAIPASTGLLDPDGKDITWLLVRNSMWSKIRTP